MASSAAGRAVLHLRRRRRRRIPEWSYAEGCENDPKLPIVDVIRVPHATKWRTHWALIARCNSAACSKGRSVRNGQRWRIFPRWPGRVPWRGVGAAHRCGGQVERGWADTQRRRHASVRPGSWHVARGSCQYCVSRWAAVAWMGYSAHARGVRPLGGASGSHCSWSWRCSSSSCSPFPRLDPAAGRLKRR